MDTQQCLKILQLECATSPEDLKKAYEDLVNVWHPDRFQHDPSLKKIAEEKLRKINLAYQHCLAYFDPDQRECFKPSNTAAWNNDSGPGEQEKAGSQNRTPSTKFSPYIDDTRSQQLSEFTDFRITKKSKRSFFRRYVLRSCICALLIVSGLGIYYLRETYNFDLQSKKPPSETIKKMANKLEIDEVVQKNIPPDQHEINDRREALKPVRTQEYYEIYLIDGSSFITKSCWEEDNMIKFKLYNGSMGLEKHKVTKIVKRRYPQRK